MSTRSTLFFVFVLFCCGLNKQHNGYFLHYFDIERTNKQTDTCIMFHAGSEECFEFVWYSGLVLLICTFLGSCGVYYKLYSMSSYRREHDIHQLTEPFKDELWYWEFVLIARHISLATLIEFCIIAIIIIGLWLNSWYSPYRDNFIDALEVFCLMCSLAMISAVFSNELVDNNDVFISIIATVLIIISLIFIVIYSFVVYCGNKVKIKFDLTLHEAMKILGDKTTQCSVRKAVVQAVAPHTVRQLGDLGGDVDMETLRNTLQNTLHQGTKNVPTINGQTVDCHRFGNDLAHDIELDDGDGDDQLTDGERKTDNDTAHDYEKMPNTPESLSLDVLSTSTGDDGNNNDTNNKHSKNFVDFATDNNQPRGEHSKLSVNGNRAAIGDGPTPGGHGSELGASPPTRHVAYSHSRSSRSTRHSGQIEAPAAAPTTYFGNNIVIGDETNSKRQNFSVQMSQLGQNIVVATPEPSVTSTSTISDHDNQGIFRTTRKNLSGANGIGNGNKRRNDRSYGSSGYVSKHKDGKDGKDDTINYNARRTQQQRAHF